MIQNLEPSDFLPRLKTGRIGYKIDIMPNCSRPLKRLAMLHIPLRKPCTKLQIDIVVHWWYSKIFFLSIIDP